MKKKITLVGLIAVMGLTTFLLSCDDEEKLCSCTESDYEGYNATRNVAPSSFGAANCADLEIKLKIQADGEFMYSCH